MKCKEYEKRDGSIGKTYSLEKGDKFKVNTGEVKEYEGKFGIMYSIEIETDGEDGTQWLRLTGGQAKFFDRFEIMPGTELIAEGYSIDKFPGKEFVGIRYVNKEDIVKKGEGKVPSSPKALPSLDKPKEAVLSSDEETCINQLIGNSAYTPWKTYAKDNVIQFKESLDGVAEKMGLPVNLNGERLEEAFKAFLSRC